MRRNRDEILLEGNLQITLGSAKGLVMVCAI